MFGLGVWELLIILAIILVLFGAKRLRNLGTDLGSAIKGFRSAVKDDEDEVPGKSAEDDHVIEGQVGRSRSEATPGSEGGSTEQGARWKQDSNV